MTVGEVFDNFFDNPRWEYFLADTNEHVVEFRGSCLYEEVEVEALIQFIVTEEEFYTDYLSFNQVPQNMLMLDALIATVFQLEINQPIIDYSYKETRKEDFWYGEIDIWPGYLIGELFPDGFYTDLQWHTYDNIIYISGYYPGEIVPEEGSFVQMKLEFLQDNLYRVKNMYLNEKVIPSEDGWLIMLDLISFVK